VRPPEGTNSLALSTAVALTRMVVLHSPLSLSTLPHNPLVDVSHRFPPEASVVMAKTSKPRKIHVWTGNKNLFVRESSEQLIPRS
jgi:hypothetical protein